MATVVIYLRSGQTITLRDSEVIKTSASTGFQFSTPRGLKLVTLDQTEISAITSEDEWS